MMRHSRRAVLASLAAFGTSGVVGADLEQDDTADANGSGIDAEDRFEIEDTTRILIQSDCSKDDPITAVARITGTVRRLDESEQGEVWGVSAEIIEAPVEYAQVEGTIDDQVIAEDHEDGVLLSLAPCIRVSDPHEPAVGRSSSVSISLLVSESGVLIV